MPRWGFVVAGTVLAMLVVSQLAIPPLASNAVEDRLTEGGGEAEVRLNAVPAARLLFGDGGRLEVTASGLDLDLEERVEVFDRIDSFATVDVSIEDFEAGPFEISAFELTRDAPAPYRLVSTGETSPTALVDYGTDRLGLPGGSLIDYAAGRLLGAADVPVPIDFDVELTSDDGRIHVVSGGGTIAGFPTGPLAQLITTAIVVRL